MSTLAKLARILADILRGLSDEDAYARYLAHHGVAHSAAQWRRFCAHRERAKYAGGRCC